MLNMTAEHHWWLPLSFSGLSKLASVPAGGAVAAPAAAGGAAASGAAPAAGMQLLLNFVLFWSHYSVRS